MRFHIVGIGPIGSLVAFHLRRTLPTRIPVSLVVKTKNRARALRANKGIVIEVGGVPITQAGFDVEIFDPMEEVIFDLVYNKEGEMRLPTAKERAWKRRGELSTAESFDSINTPIESLIVCTKAHSTIGVLRRLRRRLTSRSTIVLLQNGMGVYDHLLSEIYRNPHERPQFIVATTSHAARSKTHGAIFHTIHTGQGDIAFGIMPDPLNEKDFERSRWNNSKPEHERTLSLDDIAPPTSEDVPRERCSSLRDTVAALSNLKALNPVWEPLSTLDIRLRRKLVVNSCINPLSAITQSSNGSLFGNDNARFIIEAVCDEASAVFAKEAISTKNPDPTDRGELQANLSPHSSILRAPRGLRSFELQNEVFRIARKTSDNYSSMLVDLWKGRTTEIEHLNGYIYRLGKAHGIPTPSNDLLYNLIKLKEKVIPVARL